LVISFNSIGKGKGKEMATEQRYFVVVNDEEQYSLITSQKNGEEFDVPNGWKLVSDSQGLNVSKEDAMQYIGRVWQDQRPLSVRKFIQTLESGKEETKEERGEEREEEKKKDQSLPELLFRNPQHEITLERYLTKKELLQAMEEEKLLVFRFVECKYWLSLSSSLSHVLYLQFRSSRSISTTLFFFSLFFNSRDRRKTLPSLAHNGLDTITSHWRRKHLNSSRKGHCLSSCQ
jgi:uncharacterized protein YbdZ (MbtH family)